ncbi:hypothetical protein DL96DRAFT_1623445 [Flagelloscypha sp. PMI_526]|nr:hypothetical protein DL96DRAFT_1623445 [Flagelloscypha sp. PMI_526]
MSAPVPPLDRTGATPDAKLFGIPRYQPFTGGRSFDYEQKYPPDPDGKEASPEARVWLTYLDEAEMYDHDMIQGFRDTIDSLLVLAGLFSAIVATFGAQTSQAFKPDFAQLNLLVQLEQTALLRTGGNVSAMSTVPVSNITTDTPTYTTADLWINGLFFTSLSLSVATALLAVLVKQWCQAYTSVTSGSARDKVLTRQFRFDGLMKWKLPEIVGSLPLLLQLAFAVFFAGLSYFVYDLHKNISSIVIICAIIAEFLYLGSILLPAIWLECPYRIPLLFRPARTLIYFLGKMYTFFGSGRSSVFPIPRRYLPPKGPKREQTLVSLKEAERLLLSISTPSYHTVITQPMLILAQSLEWLFTLSSNAATQRIVTAAVYGCFIEYWYLPHSDTGQHLRIWGMAPSLPRFLRATPWPSMMDIAFKNVLAQPAAQAHADDPTRSSSTAWIGFLDVLFYCSDSSDEAFPTQITQDKLSSTLMDLIRGNTLYGDLGEVLLRWGASTKYRNILKQGLLHAAIESNTIHNVRWLLDHGSPVNEVVSNRGTPLMEACYKGFVDAVKLLIETGADVNTVFKGAWFVSGACTPLTMGIAGSWKLEIGELLLENGARINEAFHFNGETGTPLQFAIHVRNSGAVRCLLERGAALTPTIKDNLPRLNWVSAFASLNVESVEIEEILPAIEEIEGSLLSVAEIEGILPEIEEIEGILLWHASKTMKPHCIPTNQLGPVLNREFLA